MATNYYVDAQGRIYSGSVATSLADSTLPGGVSVNAATHISSTPTLLATVQDNCLQDVIKTGTREGSAKKAH